MKTLKWLLIILLMATPVWAKKKKEVGPVFKKVVAIGEITTGFLSFQGDSPVGLSRLLQDRMKKQIDMSGKMTALIIETASEGELTEEEQEFLDRAQTEMMEKGKQISGQDLLRYSQLMQKQMAPLIESFGAASPKRYRNVPAQVVVTCQTSTGSGAMDTGAVTGSLSDFVNIPYGVADVATEKISLSLNCTVQDPDSSRILDQNTVKGSKTKIMRLGGITMAQNSINHEEAYDRLFDQTVKKWIKHLERVAEKMPLEWRIFKADGSGPLLNAGSQAGIQKGMQLELLRRSSIQEAGVEFGKEEQPIGKAEVALVKEGYSVLRVLEGGPATVGTIVRPLISQTTESP